MSLSRTVSTSTASCISLWPRIGSSRSCPTLPHRCPSPVHIILSDKTQGCHDGGRAKSRALTIGSTLTLKSTHRRRQCSRLGKYCSNLGAPLGAAVLFCGKQTAAASKVVMSGVESTSQPTANTSKPSQSPEQAQQGDAAANMPASRRPLYPPLEPYKTGMLAVTETHSLYYEESGNPQGKPAVFLHGGPGGGTAPSNRRFFDPAFYRIILFDQRGSGQSTPSACLEDNTTWHLVADVEALRNHLGIDTWLVFGGSWGSTLALTYAETHPERVVGLVLRGIFMLREKEIRWFYQEGASAIFPEAWVGYRDAIPSSDRGDFVTAYNRRLMDESNPDVQMAAARAWTGWEMATSYLTPNQSSLSRTENDKFALAFARIENHYFINRGFFDSDSYLLENVGKIRHIPGVIVQGRYDVVCPMMSAWELHLAWPEAVFRVVADAGHSANEPGITSELVSATDRFKALFR